MTQGEKVTAAMVILVILIATGFGIWGTGEAERNRRKDLEIIKLCADGKEIPACSRQR